MLTDTWELVEFSFTISLMWSLECIQCFDLYEIPFLVELGESLYTCRIDCYPQLVERPL